MEQRLYFCADLGTSSLKAALIDNNGSLHGFVRIPFKNELSSSWLLSFYHAVELLAMVPFPEGIVPVTALAISGSGPTLVPVVGKDPLAKSLRPLYWYDPVPGLDSHRIFCRK